MFAYCTNNPANYIDNKGTCKNTFSIYLKVDCMQVDCPTSDAYGSIDITDKLNNAMKENAEELSQYRESHNFIQSTSYFIDKVKLGGDWDFKSQPQWNLDPTTSYLYAGTILRYDDVGNIHYGYVGRVLYSEELLLQMGGVVQIYTGTSCWDYASSGFDDPRDQEMIKFGSQLWEGDNK